MRGAIFRPRLRFDSSDALARSEEHTSELQSQSNLVCRLLLEKKKKKKKSNRLSVNKRRSTPTDPLFSTLAIARVSNQDPLLANRQQTYHLRFPLVSTASHHSP